MQPASATSCRREPSSERNAGGHRVQGALHANGKYADTITDITREDSSYADIHVESTAAWMFDGSPAKTVRIVQHKDPLDHRHENDQDNAKKSHAVDDPCWKHTFSEAALGAQVNGFDEQHPDDPEMQFHAAMKFKARRPGARARATARG